MGRSISQGDSAWAKMTATIIAINIVAANRKKSTFPTPNAEAVLNITIGLITGAANRKAIPVDTGTPFRSSLRTKGTTPHSQTGKRSPMKAPATMLRKVLFGSSRCMMDRSTNSSTNPEASVPRRRNGPASTKIPRKMVANTPNLCGVMERMVRFINPGRKGNSINPTDTKSTT